MRRSYKSIYRKMNKGQRKTGRKRLVYLVLILVIAAAVTGGIIFLFKSNIINFSRESGIIATSSSVNIESAKRSPTVTFKTSDGNLYNEITGVSRDDFTYNTDIKTYSPLDSDRKQYIRVNVSETEISGISYEVRDMSDGTLMERTEVAYVSDGDYTSAELDIKNLLNVNQKYQLQIRVEYSDKTLYYDTVIESRGSAYLDEKIEFVQTFTDNIYDTSKANEVFSYLSPQSDVDITNFAIADIFSPTSLVTWSTLSPTKISDAIPTIIAVDDNSTRIAVSYPIAITGIDGKSKRVIVNEVYTVRMMSTGSMSLINYQRRADETLLADSITVSSDALLLGFNSSSTVNGKTSDSREYVAFENAGNLWIASSDTLSEIFTFDADNSHNSDINTVFDVDDKGYINSYSKAYGIEILNVSDDGKVIFAVYGTQLAGGHAGETGIAIFTYQGGFLKENVFIELNASYDTLKSQASSSYVSDEGIYYIVSESAMYAINTDSYTSEKVISDIPNGEFSSSQDGSVIAYAGENDESGYSTEIHLYNRENQSESIINTDDGKVLKGIGYIGNDFVYGIADKSDIVGDTIYYSRFVIVDSDGNEVTTYEVEGMRFADPSVSANDLSFTRYNKNGDTYTEVDTNKLIGKGTTGAIGYVTAFNTSDSSSVYRKQLYMTFNNGLTFDGDANVISGWSYMNPDTATIND